MNQISLDAKGGQFLADLANWQRESAPDNSADLERLRRNLRFARQQVLTKRQQQMLELYYDQGLTMGQIAALRAWVLAVRAATLEVTVVPIFSPITSASTRL